MLNPKNVKPGQEQFKYFDTNKGQRVQYDYRNKSGELFSCIAKTLEEAREKCSAWRMRKTGAEQ